MKTVIIGMLVAFLVMISGFLIGIFTMIFGWGLQPKSWAWIIIGGFANMGIALIYTTIFSKE